MEKTTLTQNEIVIHQLMAGDSLTSKDIAEKVNQENGVDMGIREVSTIMNKLNKTDLGHFIKKKRKGRAFVYGIVEEAKYLTPDEAYGLSLKIGKNRYPLDQALEDHPELKKYVKKTRKKSAKKENKTPTASRKAASTDRSVPATADMVNGSVEEILKGLLKMMGGGTDFNVHLNVTVRFEK